MIYGYIPKSKQKKLTKIQLEQKESWLKEIDKLSSKRYSTRTVLVPKITPMPSIPPGRETPRYQSVDTGFIPCTKRSNDVYTGDKIKGIGTMHKSNAVPVFTDNEAKDIASMRR